MCCGVGSETGHGTRERQSNEQPRRFGAAELALFDFEHFSDRDGLRLPLDEPGIYRLDRKPMGLGIGSNNQRAIAGFEQAGLQSRAAHE